MLLMILMDLSMMVTLLMCTMAGEQCIVKQNYSPAGAPRATMDGGVSSPPDILDKV
jgi:hypothetical protein